MHPSVGGAWVVVTGASSGIGRASALALAEAGFRVLGGVRSDEDGRALAAEGGGRIVPVRLDVTVASEVAALARTVAEHVGDAGLAGLVNNAGVAVAGPLEFLPLDDLRRQFEVNVVGQVAVTQALLPQLRKARSTAGGGDGGGERAGATAGRARRPGRIVFVGSISGLIATRLLGAYAASKFALEAIGDVFRRELGPWGVGVAVVEPGRIATGIWGRARAAGRARLRRMPADAGALYARAIDDVMAGSDGAEREGIAPEAVARAVVHALTAARPRTRYRVGVDAVAAAALVRHLPDRWVDGLLQRLRR